MTTIILVILGVLIAAAAALFMIFYGGDAYNEADTKAEATRLVNEGVQIQAAVQAYRAQEGTMPGTGAAVDDTALRDLVCADYLRQVPVGMDPDSTPTYDCSNPNAALPASPWKIDYNLGIARMSVGPALDANGKETSAYLICRAARKQFALPGDPLRCDDSAITSKEPCCIMDASQV